jgi:hypothetical protein
LPGTALAPLSVLVIGFSRSFKACEASKSCHFHRQAINQMDTIMNRLLLTAVAVLLSSQAFGASVNISGSIDIHGLPHPPLLVLPTPVIVTPGPAVVEREPVYLHVPADHRKHWDRYCHQYNACGEHVYFVQDNWYQNVYVPHRAHYEHDHHDYHEYHDDHGHHGGPDHHDDHGHHGPDHDDDHHHDHH